MNDDSIWYLSLQAYGDMLFNKTFRVDEIHYAEKYVVVIDTRDNERYKAYYSMKNKMMALFRIGD